ncbi:MAG TPA: hypothetical protein VF532_08580, partial [Candidatus Angelobacter sp.]
VPARLACIRHEYKTAVELFDQSLAQADLGAISVNLWDVVYYAVALARNGDARARTLAVAAEQRVKTESGRVATLAWWCMAETYALLKDAESAVRCLRASLAHEPKLVRRWLADPGSAEVFEGIRRDPVFAALEGEMLAVPR